MLSDINEQLRYYNSIRYIYDTVFTPREIDVISCILNGCTASKEIGILLCISHKSVDANKYNIGKKLDLTSMTDVREFVESSELYKPIKKHYKNLIYRKEVRDVLGDISRKLQGVEKKECTIFISKKSTGLSEVKNIKTILNHMGVKLQISHNDSGNNDSNDLPYLSITGKDNTSKTDIIFVVLPNIKESEALSLSRKVIDFRDNYYDALFELLDLLIEGFNINQEMQIIKNILALVSQEQIGGVESSNSVESTDTKVNRSSTISKLMIAAIVICGFVYITLRVGNNILSQEIIRSDLVTPPDNILLKRPIINKKIDFVLSQSRFSGHLPWAVILGTSGSGKTTVARNYGRNIRNAAVVWEVNAEKLSTIMSSFRELAYRLAESRKHTEELDGIIQIANIQVQEKQLLAFIKSRLREKPNWLLIYDNVTSLVKIIQFMPIYSKEWGNGKVIITTHNSHITESSYIDPQSIIRVNELETSEMIELLSRILFNCPSYADSKEKLYEMATFLKNIPPFPLDVSIAAYLIKNTGVTYDRYLSIVKDYGSDYESMQLGLLREITNYEKTRYGIIFSTLEELKNIDSNFNQIFFIICALDSVKLSYFQNKYYDSADFTKFIYNLRKKGILMKNYSDDFNKKSSIVSLHRATRDIGTVYLQRKLTHKEKKQYIEKLTESLTALYNDTLHRKNAQNYEALIHYTSALLDFIEKIGIPNINHYRVRLNRMLGYTYLSGKQNFSKALHFLTAALKYNKPNNCLSNRELAELYKDLGLIYSVMILPKKSIEACNKSLELLEKVSESELLQAENLKILGSAYRKSDNFEKTKEYLERAVQILKKPAKKKHLPEYSEVLQQLGVTYLFHYLHKDGFKLAEQYFIDALEYDGTNRNLYNQPLDARVNCESARHQWKYSQVFMLHYQDYRTSVEWLKSAEYIRQNKCAENLFLKGKIMGSVGNAKLRQNKLEEALGLLNESIRLINLQLGTSTWMERELLCEIYNRVGNYEMAYKHFLAINVLAQSGEKNTVHHLSLCKAYFSGAYAALRLYKDREAIECLEDLIVLLKAYCSNNIDSRQYKTLLQKNKFATYKYRDKNLQYIVKKYMHNAYDIFETIYGTNHPFVKEYIKPLISN